MADVLLSGKATVTPVGTDKVVIVDDPGGADAIRLATIDTIRGTVQGTDATYDIRPANDGATPGSARAENTVDLQTSRTAESKVVSGLWSSLLGGDNNRITGDYSVCGGGKSNLVTADYAVIAGGDGGVASGARSAVPGGEGAVASEAYSYARNRKTTASGESSSATGYQSVSDKYGQWSIAGGRFAANGDAQSSVLVSRISTTNATPAELFLDGTAARATIATDTTWVFRVTVVARRTDADDESYGSTHEGVIDNNAGTTALVAGATDTVLADDSTGMWTVAVTADDTNDSLLITVTGEAAKTIRWVARIELTEVSG